MKALKVYHHVVFGIIFIAELLLLIFNMPQLEIIVKPLILIWIIYIFICSLPMKSKIFRWGLPAFLFSLAGDFVLIFAAKNEIFFIAGIGCFLLAHFFFLITFTQHPHKNPSYLKSKPIWMIIILLIGITLYAVLFSHIDNVMKVAVLIYASAISAMLLMAVNRKNQVPSDSFLWVTLGAMLFFISDSLLAINKFWISIHLSGIWIMGTYMLAQYFILAGLVKQENHTNAKNHIL